MLYPLIPVRIHGWLDDGMVLLYLGGAWVLHLEGDGLALALAFAGLHFLLTRLTAYPQGALKWIPLPVHAFLELAEGIAIGGFGYVIAGFDAIRAGAFLEVMGASHILIFAFCDQRWQTAAPTR